MTRHTLPAAIAIVALALPTAAHARVLKGPPEFPVFTPAQTGAAPSRPAATPGFQWDDAGIGAATTALLLGGGVLVAGATRRRRTPLPT